MTHTYVNVEKVLQRLTPQSHYSTKELAGAFSVTAYCIQYLAKKHQIGRLMRRSGGGHGHYVFTNQDVKRLASHMVPRKFSPIRHS